MEITEKRQKDEKESFIQSAAEAKKTLLTIEKDIKKKSDHYSRTIDKVKEKCLTQFETQRDNYRKYEEISDNRLHHFSMNAVNKFNLQQQKSRELSERMNHSVDAHRTMNDERFYTRDEGLKKAKNDRDDFLKREDRRHRTKLEARERILKNISIENAQKKELRKLRVMDTTFNLERERKRKQES